MWRCEKLALRELGLTSDVFWGMTFRELMLMLEGKRQRERLRCAYAALVCQYIAAYSGVEMKGGNRVPTIKSIVDKVLGEED